MSPPGRTQGERRRACAAFRQPLRPALSLALALALALSGCAGGPPAPDWALEARSGLERFSRAELEGRGTVAQAEFARARAALAATGEPARVARAELLRCATRVASLDAEGCPGFDALAIDATAEDRAYAAYLAGRAGAADLAALPEAQRALAASGPSPEALRGAADPLSALVAAGVAVRRLAGEPPAPAGAGGPQGADPRALAAAAVDRAAAQGWRRPLLAWLGLQRRLALRDGDTALAERLGRRIALAGGEPPAAPGPAPAGSAPR
ncbi:hypothetical protein [Piscinibacter sakaiensis]|uniref:Lipoprotein n=1 Tax=Piscinibacter sakaiensis TaxID=1547922 RepID=A0A0K8NXP0_PISS1|nr:hypothetical protein [Piscinibacter sakaiensis]GAP35152.1 hypothetical protein ISF6_0723 [Piscinibacter sakaiensis]